MTLLSVVVLAVGSFVLRAVGIFAGGRRLSPRLASVVALLPAALLAALVAVQTVEDGGRLVADARLAAVAAAAVAVLLRAPFAVVVIVGMATAAGLRAVGIG